MIKPTTNIVEMKTAIKITKQSLIDWQVTRNGEHLAWITKGKDGLFQVRYERNENYDFASFKAAKSFVKETPHT